MPSYEPGGFWDIPFVHSQEPRHRRIRNSSPPSERFLIEEKKQRIGFSSPIIYTETQNKETRGERLSKRPLPKSPFRVLDAPSIINDYYLNLLDWGPNNILALGLSEHLYLWNAETKRVTHLMSTSPSNYVSSVSFSPTGQLAVGTSEGLLLLYDTEKGLLSQMERRETRVSSLSWGPGILSSGAKDGSIYNYDTRANEHVSSFLTHTQEVCGLSWNKEETHLASGSNDNTACVWRVGCIRPKVRLQEHTSAIRAVAWCPWKQGILATGGGTDDRTIRVWDTEKGKALQRVDTGSQVTGILFSEKYKELITTHGYTSNSVCIWKFCTMRKIGTMDAHTDRVLYSALSPDGETLATCAADENLNFWRLFEHPHAPHAPHTPHAPMR
ncbi:cell division cycle 20, cofactor of APC complex [Nematocida sp. LUAm3]|nr:cell division cycle 20, cofactor of APC complex [Nematocida sp. LUAm3]KAI5173878.1 cell division cycle 20, cofactor of APC complex [Nematocida sp. LUAm2]KAI5177377.1 cell division cycle 20, cofactor of APC complex [Nematocida sp. LUAm1]